MPFTLKSVVPWGRSYEEYAAMFSLSKRDMGKRILGCADGPADFNAVLSERGGSVVSVDPIYRFGAAAIRRRINATCNEVLEQTRRNHDEFIWKTIKSVEHLRRVRMEAMEHFLGDYPAGVREGRYVVGSLPKLPFATGVFELSLCSHYLFLYSEQLSLNEHVAAVREMCRVAGEARFFPLLELGARPSRHLGGVKAALEQLGYRVRVKRVKYEFQKGGNELLTVMAPGRRAR